MLTSYEDSELVFESLKAGASGYLLKLSSPEEILAALRDVHKGGARSRALIDAIKNRAGCPARL